MYIASEIWQTKVTDEGVEANVGEVRGIEHEIIIPSSELTFSSFKTKPETSLGLLTVNGTAILNILM